LGDQAKRKVTEMDVVKASAGWHRQVQLGDGGFYVRRTIVKAKGLGDATHDLNDLAFAPPGRW
jgi:hypothetical protein